MKTPNLHRGLPQKSPESIVVSGLLRLRNIGEFPIRHWRNHKDPRMALRAATKTLITKFPKKIPEIMDKFRSLRTSLPHLPNSEAHQVIHDALSERDTFINTILSVPRRRVSSYSHALAEELDRFFPHSQDAYLIVIVKKKDGKTRLLY